MPALAITDHGNLFGAIEFYQKCISHGIKPIIGCEAYIVSNGSRKDRDPRRTGEGGYNHLVLLAKNHKGYQNLCRLITLSYLEGFYYKPRIDKEILQEYNEGLIAMSACFKGEIPSLIRKGNIEEAKLACEWFLKVFSAERFFIELMDVGLEDCKPVNEKLISLAKTVGIGLAATNDCHYLSREDAPVHDALLCIQTGKTLESGDRLQFGSDQFYFRPPGEMERLFSNVPEAISNTLLIASKCNLELDLKSYHFPKFSLPEGTDLAGYLEEKAWAGLETKIAQLNEEKLTIYKDRLKRELEMIKKMGFASYFLIVADFINWAKGKGIPVGPGRGSAAGSLVAYCLNITDVDPIPNKLFFERFLNPERVSMPDMDIDFCMRRRPEVIDYVKQKYGYVSQIITFGKMKARAVIRDVGRVMGLPYGDVDKIAKLIPFAVDMTINKALEIEPQLKKILKEDERIAKLIRIAKALEGFPRHASTHAAGVVMGDQPLDMFLPLYVGQHDEIITQYDMKAVEKIGLIKFDFLGLKTLTVMNDAIEIIKKRHGTEINLSRLTLNDKLVYKHLSDGETPGIFQLESSGMTDLVMKLKPTCFEDIVALVALFRPGPLGSGMVEDFINRKHGRTKIEYELPQLASILKETYGVIVYQEQVMQIASALAGFTLGDADLLRRAMGKKKAEEMALQRTRFLEGCAKNKIASKKAEKIFDLMAEFAGYGFNKCIVEETELIDVKNGEIFTIADLVKSGTAKTTVSCNSRYKIEPKKITNVVSNGRKKVFKLRTHLGYELTATGNHPLLTATGWRALDELKSGDRIAAPRELTVRGKSKMPRHEIISMAWLISEGNTCHPSSLYFYNNDKALIDDFVENISKFPHTNARVYKRRGKTFEVCVNTGSFSHVPWNAKDRVKRCRMNPALSGAFTWAGKMGLLGKKASVKEVPKSIFRLNNNQIALFLGRLWSGDGYVFGGTNPIPFYATSSFRLAGQIQHLLLRFGIVSRIAHKSFKYRGGLKKGYALFVTGEGSAMSFLSKIIPHMVGRKKAALEFKKYLDQDGVGVGCRDTIPWEVKWKVREEKAASGKTWVDIERESKLSMKEFYGGKHACKRGFRRETINKLGRYFNSRQLIDISCSDIYWDEVKEIKAAGIRDTYDITVDGNHNFIANGLIVHNSHSAAYALIAYQTAYLRYNYPTEFMASLLTSEMGNTDKLLFYMNACREDDIKVLPPDVNASLVNFTVTAEKEIRFGMAAVKNVGEAAVEAIISARSGGGNFKSLDDFCARIDSRKVNKRVVESLIKCGAFDNLGVHRAELLATSDVAMARAVGIQRDREIGQTGLFDLVPEVSKNTGACVQTGMIPWSEHELLQFEKEALGFYISGHPLAQFESIMKLYATASTDVLAEKGDGNEVKIGGVVASLREITTKKGDRMGFVTLEDLKGMADVIVFPELYLKAIQYIKSDQPLFIIGTLDIDEERAKIIAREIFPISEAPAKLTKTVHFKLAASETDEKQLQNLKNILGRFKGECKVFLHLTIPDRSETVMELPADFCVAPSLQLVSTVEKIFGHNVTYFQS